MHGIAEGAEAPTGNDWFYLNKNPGDYEISPFFDPPLSVVSVSRKLLGSEASRLLLRQLGPNPNPPTKVEIPVEATLRASTGHDE